MVRHILCATHAQLSVDNSIGDFVTHSVTPFDFGTQRVTLETCYLETFDQSDEETYLNNILTSFSTTFTIFDFFAILEILTIYEKFEKCYHFDNDNPGDL